MAKMVIHDLQAANFNSHSEDLVEITSDEQSNITGGLGITIPVDLSSYRSTWAQDFANGLADRMVGIFGNAGTYYFYDEDPNQECFRHFDFDRERTLAFSDADGTIIAQ